MNEVRACKCGTIFEREHQPDRAVTMYRVYGAQSACSEKPATQQERWDAGECPSCGMPYEKEAPPVAKVAATTTPATNAARSVSKVVWFLLKLFVTLLMLSCCVTDQRDMGWVRGATGDSLPLIATMAGYTVLLYWAYCVIWVPIKPEKVEKQ